MMATVHNTSRCMLSVHLFKMEELSLSGSNQWWICDDKCPSVALHTHEHHLLTLLQRLRYLLIMDPLKRVECLR